MLKNTVALVCACVVSAALFSGCVQQVDKKMIIDETANAAVSDVPQKDAVIEGAVKELKNAEKAVHIAAFTSVTDNYIANVLGELKMRDEARLKFLEEEEIKNNPYYHIPPDESGKVMIPMFHNFTPQYKEGGDKKITMELGEFRNLLQYLYDNGYRTVALGDFIRGNIALPKGTKPIVFTFDDARPTQFEFVKNADGTISESTETAVYVMEQFYLEHPDFGLNGTFFVNMGFGGTFGTVGTLEERIGAMLDKGFDIQSHTVNHENLAKLTTAAQFEAAIGGNSKMLNDMFPDKKMDVLALPYGNNNKAFTEYIEHGFYDGFEYTNVGIMLVGSEPASQMYLKTTDSINIRRILASGITPVDGDLGWWLKNLDKTPIFISDGDPNTVTVPSSRADLIDAEMVAAMGKNLVIYE